MDSIDIIDLFVKFGLGAIFGGSAVYFTIKDRLDKQKKYNAGRRVNLLEDVAQHVGKVSHVFGKYATLVMEVGPNAGRMSVKQERELEELNNDLVEVYQEIAIAESKLLLLGEKKLDKALKIYTGKMAQFRKQFYPGRYTSTEDLNTNKKETSAMREQFYDILSERYDQIIQQ